MMDLMTVMTIFFPTITRPEIPGSSNSNCSCRVDLHDAGDNDLHSPLSYIGFWDNVLDVETSLCMNVDVIQFNFRILDKDLSDLTFVPATAHMQLQNILLKMPKANKIVLPCDIYKWKFVNGFLRQAIPIQLSYYFQEVTFKPEILTLRDDNDDDNNDDFGCDIIETVQSILDSTSKFNNLTKFALYDKPGRYPKDLSLFNGPLFSKALVQHTHPTLKSLHLFNLDDANTLHVLEALKTGCCLESIVIFYESFYSKKQFKDDTKKESANKIVKYIVDNDCAKSLTLFKIKVDWYDDDIEQHKQWWPLYKYFQAYLSLNKVRMDGYLNNNMKLLDNLITFKDDLRATFYLLRSSPELCNASNEATTAFSK